MRTCTYYLLVYMPPPPYVCIGNLWSATFNNTQHYGHGVWEQVNVIRGFEKIYYYLPKQFDMYLLQIIIKS